jgi:hypothetical protein
MLQCCRPSDAPRASDLHQQPRGGSESTPSSIASSSSLAQRIRELKATFPDADVQTDPSGSRVVTIRGLVPPVAEKSASTTSAEDVVRAVLKNSAVSATLGLRGGVADLCQPVTRRDSQLRNYALVRISQCVNGVRVMGAELVMNVRLEPTPAVDTLTSSIVTTVPRTTIPAVSAAAASRAAAEAVRKGSVDKSPSEAGRPDESQTAPELVIFSPERFQLDGPSRLCWLVRVKGTVVLIDAITGAVVHTYADVI